VFDKWIIHEDKENWENCIVLDMVSIVSKKRSHKLCITSWNSWLDTKRESTSHVEFLMVMEMRFLSVAPVR
jgi:hypothetical protein